MELKHQTKSSSIIIELQTAISIGLKSLQMSETKIDCHSYIDPLKQMIDDSTSESKNSLHLIDEN